MTKMKVALLSHPFKDDNLGCAALAISNLKIIDEVFDKLHIDVSYVIAVTENLEQIDISQYTKNSFEYRLYPRCRQTLKNPLKLLTTRIFDGCDIAFNLCGGDGYTDIYGFGRLMAESQLAWIAKMRRIPLVYAPQTIGPFNTKKGILLAKATLNTIKHIFVRDGASRQCSNKLGFAEKTTEVIDVAFALPFEKKLSASNPQKKIGINVSGLLYNGGYNRNNYFGLSFDYCDFINELLQRLTSDDQYEVHLIPHVNSEDNDIEDDYRVCEILAEKYHCLLAPRYGSPIDVKNYIATMDVFSGARMHSTIGALSSGVPVIPVAYSRKFNGLYQSLNYPWLIDAKSKIDLHQAIDLFFNYLGNVHKMKANVDTAVHLYSEKLRIYEAKLNEVISSFL